MKSGTVNDLRYYFVITYLHDDTCLTVLNNVILLIKINILIYEKHLYYGCIECNVFCTKKHNIIIIVFHVLLIYISVFYLLHIFSVSKNIY